MYLQRAAGNRATHGLLHPTRGVVHRSPAVIQRLGPTLTLTNVAVTNALPVAGSADHFVTTRGAPAGDALIAVTVTSSTGVVPANSVRWTGGSAGADQTQRVIRPTSAGDRVVTVVVGSTRRRIHIHVVKSDPLPASTPARLRHTKAGRANPGGDFGLTVVTIGTQGVKGPEFDITAHLVGDQWTFRVKEIRHKFKLGVTSQGRRNVAGAGGVTARQTRQCGDRPDPTRRGDAERSDARAVLEPDYCHGPRERTRQPLLQFRRVLADVDGRLSGRGRGHDGDVRSRGGSQDRRGRAARPQGALEDARRLLSPVERDDSAEIAGSEVHCHGVSNPMYTVLFAGLVAAVRPPAPRTLTATAATATSVRLAWVRGGVNETGYVIQRRQGRGAFTALSGVGLLPTTFTDTTAVVRHALYLPRGGGWERLATRPSQRSRR